VRLYPQWRRAQEEILRSVAATEWARALDALTEAAARRE
jgi:hypothetical protein